MSARPDTAIREIIIRRARFPLERPFRSAVVLVDAVHLVLVELRTEGGPSGLAYGFAFRRGDARMIEAALEALSEIVAGQDVMATEALWRRMSDAMTFVGRGGPALAALSVIDMAAWDAKARALATPLHRLLGAARTEVPAYASGGSLAGSATELADEMGFYAEQGFTSMKLKLGSSDRANAERLAAVRQAVGPDALLYVDGNQQWHGADAVRAAAALEPFDIGWLEEPLAAEEIDALAALRQRVRMPIATGETNYGLDDFRRLIAAGAADILMPNLQRVGGVTGWLRIAQAAALAGVRIASHVDTPFMLPLMCAVPNGVTLEYVPWWPDPFREPVRLDGGMAVPSDAPGFGVTLDEARLEHNPA